MQEIELKFLVPESKVEALMRQAHIKSSKISELAAHYFDTPKQELSQAGIALRIRKEGDDWVQTVKATGDGMAARLEHNQTLEDETVEHVLNDTDFKPDLSGYKEGDIATVFNDFKLKKLNDNLVRQYITDVKRITRLIKKEGNIIEVAYDTGEILHGEDANIKSAIKEIEFELIEGDPAFLFEVAKIWCKRYKLCLSTVTKAERGNLLLEQREYPTATKSDLKQLDINEDMTQSEFMRAVVHNCMLQILPNASAIAAGSDDGNHVHQLRVGIRRLRTAFKFFEGFSNDLHPDWIPVLKQTFSILGEYRDREVLQLKTQPMLETLGGPFVDWQPERDSLKIRPIDAVRANDFQLTLLELIEYSMGIASLEGANDNVTNDSDSGDNTDKPAIKAVSKILDKLFKKISKASEHFADLDIDAQHDVRKRLKSLRYISEFAAPMYKKKKSKDFLQYLEPAQDVLGDYNDNMVGHEFYQDKTPTDPNAWFAVGYFGAQEQHAAEESAKSLKTIKDAPKFW